jgi:hypothetical protein
MKYMLLLVRDDEAWESLSDADRDYESIIRWWMSLGERGVLLGGDELEPARTATTVRWAGGKPVVTDGPYAETKETVGGFGIVEVANLDEAIAIAQSWPAVGHKVEIRPVVAR